eukprot:15448910-Alexandrium_andersonii.AAC.1
MLPDLSPPLRSSVGKPLCLLCLPPAIPWLDSTRGPRVVTVPLMDASTPHDSEDADPNTDGDSESAAALQQLRAAMLPTPLILGRPADYALCSSWPLRQRCD